jgi:hypothetical protein
MQEGLAYWAASDIAMTGEEFLGYVEIHCRTELALFHKAHIYQLFAMAGKRKELDQLSYPLPNFISMRLEVALPLVGLAREALKELEVTRVDRKLVGDEEK